MNKPTFEFTRKYSVDKEIRRWSKMGASLFRINKEYFLILYKDTLVTKDMLFPCYHKAYNRVDYRKGTRCIRLGTALGEGSSRIVFKHPTDKTSVIKLDLFALHDKHVNLFSKHIDCRSKYHNQNLIEEGAFNYFKQRDVGNEVLPNIASVKGHTNKYFMLEQEYIEGFLAYDSLRMDTSDRIEELREKMFEIVEPGLVFKDSSGLDIHHANVLVQNYSSQLKVVDLGFIKLKKECYKCNNFA